MNILKKGRRSRGRPGRPDFEARTEVVHRAAVRPRCGRPAVDSVPRRRVARQRKNNGLGEAKAGPVSTAAERRSMQVSGHGSAARGINRSKSSHRVTATSTPEMAAVTRTTVSGRLATSSATAARPARRSGPRADRNATARSGKSDSASSGPRLDRPHQLTHDLRLGPAAPMDVQEHRRPEQPQCLRARPERRNAIDVAPGNA